MGFQQGLSGLNSASSALDVVGNNVSNSGTIGFKAARAEFADVYAASLAGAGASQVGIGNRVSNVAQQFTQGNVTSTSNALDVAINGNGMFVMADSSGTQTYTRNGQFQLDKNGYLINADGLNVQGYAADYTSDAQGTISTTTATNIYVDPSGIQPQASTTAALNVNLDSREKVPAHATFSTTDPLSYNKSTSIPIYDSLGNPHTLSMYFLYTNTTSEAYTDPSTGAATSGTVSNWTVHYAVDGNTACVSGAGEGATLNFDTSGRLVEYNHSGSLTTQPTLTIDLAAIDPNNKALTPQVITGIDYGSSTQFGATFGVNSESQNGFASGRLTKISIGADGLIQGNYSNGQTRNMAQIVIARFTNPNGLINLGGNQWQQTFASGPALLGVPGSSSNGVLQGSALEESTVDLTKELVDMITYQRAYQANAQTIKTQDSLLQTITNLR
jgi:flagellar hook protein FlgE